VATNINVKSVPRAVSSFPWYGWLGILLGLGGWFLNWTLPGLRTQWAFFPMWLGYCLGVDGLVRSRTGTSLLARSGRGYAGLFVISAPVWWIFEAINVRTHNWVYLGTQQFAPLQFALWTTLSFTTVVPAVFGSAELVASFGFLRRLGTGPRIGIGIRTTLGFFGAGWLMLALMLAWPTIFFPFAWICLYFILEPINVWMGNHSLAEWTRNGDWRPVLALWMGVLLTAFFWEMWNFHSYPKWVYHVPWGNWLHVFEMPLLGYGGYLPFSLELFAVYHFVQGLLGRRRPDYVHLVSR
jgi:hypothetical protein